jgi:hypothetical protein
LEEVTFSHGFTEKVKKIMTDPAAPEFYPIVGCGVRVASPL